MAAAVSITTSWCDGSSYNVVVNALGNNCASVADVFSSFSSVAFGGQSCWGPSGNQFWCSAKNGCPAAGDIAAIPICVKVLAHTDVVPYPEQPATNNIQAAALRFKPYLHVDQATVPGCAEFPSVDASGAVGGGLKTGGSSNGDCASAPHGGQVYVRSTQYKDRWAIMYAWYWPKDQEAVGVGHRHDWESTVVFINDVNAAPENQKIIEVAASAHGAFRQYNPPNPDTMEGTHVHIKYFTGGIKDHSTDTWDNPTLGESPVLPIIHWDQLSPAARFTLQNYDFGNANFPLRDPNFMDNLAKAYI